MTTAGEISSDKVLEDLAARVQSLEDERAVLEVLARFSFAVDADKHDEFVDLFTPDAEFHYPAYDVDLFDATANAVSTLTVYRGPIEILQLLSSKPHVGIRHRCQHYAQGGPAIIVVDHDQATCYSYYASYAVEDADDLTVKSHKHGFVIWTFARVDGAWKISGAQRRRMGSPDQAEVLDRFPVSEERV